MSDDDDGGLAPAVVFAEARAASAALARALGHALPGEPLPASPEAAAAVLGLVAQPVDARVPELAHALARVAPALVALDDGWLALRGVRFGRARLVASDGREVRVPLAALVSRLRAPLEREVEAALATSRLADGVRAALVADRVESRRVALGFTLEPRPQALAAGATRLGDLLASARGPRLAAGALEVLRVALELLAWALVAGVALDEVEVRWLLLWLALLPALVVLRAGVPWLETLAAERLVIALERRGLAGALSAGAHTTGALGVQATVARLGDIGELERATLDANASLVRGGLYFAVALALVPWTAGLLALGALGLGVALAPRLAARRAAWRDERRTLAADLVEKMVGHRTRLVQVAPSALHDGEDAALARHAAAGVALDRVALALRWLGPLWLALALAVLALAPPHTPLAAALALAGLVLGAVAFDRLALGAASAIAARQAWASLEALFGTPPSDAEGPAAALARARAHEGSGAIAIADARCVYPGRADAVALRGDVAIAPGERVLLTGPSGAGKSTLLKLVSGARAPDHGRVTIDGEPPVRGGDPRVAVAPQFHENHIYGEPFIDNLLLGRPWPTSAADVERAEEILRDVGLGPLLERMPSQLDQMLGDSGWQLSHGERSRVFIARALLQGAPVVVLDESLAALDADSVEAVLAGIQRHAPTLLLVAHP